MRRAGKSSAVFLASIVVAAWFVAGDAAFADGPALPDELSHIRFAGGNGISLDQAVIVLNAENTKQGVAAENYWMKWKYEGSKKLEQQLSTVEERQYDVVAIELESGAQVEIWFDITEFYGKW